MGFLNLFLPALSPVTESLAMTRAPLSMHAFAYRWLLFRLLFGFGKLKFMGSSWREDGLYLKGFFVAQPLPNRFGWFGHHLPAFLHRFSLVVMFIAEIIVPFFYFGSWSAWAALTTVALMLGIVVSGNFGFFNYLTMVLCIPLFDSRAYLTQDSLSPLAHHASGSGSSCGGCITLAVLWALLPGSAFNLLLSSWLSQSWYYWPTLQRLPLIHAYRLLQPWHILHAFGVFPPKSAPSARFLPVFEGSEYESHEDFLRAVAAADAAAPTASSPSKGSSQKSSRRSNGKAPQEWKRYLFRFQTCSETKAPPFFVAPFHPRFEMYCFYSGLGMVRDNFNWAVLAADPYRFTKFPVLERAAQRLLEGGEQGALLAESFADARGGHNPFPDLARPPKRVRVRLCMFTPAALTEAAAALGPTAGEPPAAAAGAAAATGTAAAAPPARWWHETVVADHVPPTRSRVRRNNAHEHRGSRASPSNPLRSMHSVAVSVVSPE